MGTVSVIDGEMTSVTLVTDPVTKVATGLISKLPKSPIGSFFYIGVPRHRVCSKQTPMKLLKRTPLTGSVVLKRLSDERSPPFVP